MTQTEIAGLVQSTKLFERDGMFDYGTWRKWCLASPDEARVILDEFRANEPG